MKYMRTCLISIVLCLVVLGTFAGVGLSAKRVVKYWPGYGLTPAAEEWEKYLKAEWKKTHPDIELVIEHPSGEFGVYAAAGVLPDLYDAESRGPMFYRQGLLMSLEDYMAKTPELAPERFLAGIGEMMKDTVTGNIYQLPFSLSFEGIVYNREMFEDAGLDSDPKSVSTWDWGRFVSYAQKLTKYNPDGSFSVWGFTPIMWSAEAFVSWLMSNDGVLFQKDKPRVNTPEGIETLRFLADLRLKHKVAFQKGGPIVDMAERKCAMADGHNGVPGYIWGRTNPDFPISMVPYPRGPKGNSQVSPVMAGFMAIPKGAKNPDLGLELARFIITELTEAAARIFPQRFGKPCLKEFYSKKEWLAGGSKTPEGQILASCMPFFRSFPIWPLSIFEYSPPIMKHYGMVASGSLAPEVAAERIDKDLAIEIEKVLSGKKGK